MKAIKNIFRYIGLTISLVLFIPGIIIGYLMSPLVAGAIVGYQANPGARSIIRAVKEAIIADMVKRRFMAAAAAAAANAEATAGAEATANRTGNKYAK